MNNHPLMGVSILAVVLLILGSLSNVVGYQSLQSSDVNDSPLFSVRTQRATNQQQNTFTLQYLGKGTGNILQFSPRDTRTESLKKAIEYINKMEDKTFAQFKELCIQKVRQDKTISDTKPIEILQILRQFRINPESIIDFFISSNNYNTTSSDLHTIFNLLPGCIPDIIIITVIAVLLMVIAIIVVLDWMWHSFALACDTSNRYCMR
jgi:hypothetical protein